MNKTLSERALELKQKYPELNKLIKKQDQIYLVMPPASQPNFKIPNSLSCLPVVNFQILHLVYGCVANSDKILIVFCFEHVNSVLKHNIIFYNPN